MNMAIVLCGVLGALAACAGSRSRYDGIAGAVERGDTPKTTSVLVMRGSTIEYERYFAGATAETLHDTRSAGKSLTALAVGAAIGRRVLPGLDAPAFGYLADLAPFAADGPAKAAITIEDLLTMSSALDCDDSDEASPGNEENMYPRQVWARWAVDLPVRADYRRDAGGRGPWHYCTAGTFLLGQILQRAAGQPIDRVMAETLFAPLGITAWEFAKSPTGEIMTGGGLRLRTRDLASAARLMLAGGTWANQQVVPAEFVRAALTAQREATLERQYGYLFWTRMYRTPCGTTRGWFMSGNGGNVVVMFRELDAVVVITRTNYNTRGMHQQTTRLIEEQILPALACRHV
jgi:CubicO group peptidase (beta-lactamase class C family)